MYLNDIFAKWMSFIERNQFIFYTISYFQTKIQTTDMGELVLALRSRAAAIRNGQLASVIFMRTRIPKKLHVSYIIQNCTV